MKSNRGGKFIAEKPLSQNPQNIRRRERRLTDDSFLEKVYKSNKRSRNKKSHFMAVMRLDLMTKTCNEGTLLKRVRFHLSKGRDAGRIAVAEGKPVSKIIAAIEQIKKEAA